MKPSGEFFTSLGQYVYQYVNHDTLQPYYTGKGNGDRCISHVEDKGFPIDDCYIVARNLEKFEDKKDWQSFLLESYLIATHDPEANSVSGHYKECFVMASLSSLFTDFQAEQHDNFETLPEWYLLNYDAFRGKLREIKIWSANTFFLSNARNSINMMWYWSPTDTESPIKVTFEVNKAEGEELTNIQTNLKKWLALNGYKKTKADGKIQKLAIDCPTIEDVVELFREFNK